MSPDASTMQGTVLGTWMEGSASSAILAVYIPGENGRLVGLPDGAEVTFGRSRSAVVSIESEKVSRLHAKLWRSGDQFFIEDLRSRNGTRVNQQTVTGAHSLQKGDQIDIGPMTALITMASPYYSLPSWPEDELQRALVAESDRCIRYKRSFGVFVVRVEDLPSQIDGGRYPQIVQVHERLQRHIRPMDSLWEFGPNQLVVLVPELSSGDAQLAAQEMLAAIRQDSGKSKEPSANIGIALFPDHGDNPQQLLSAAVSALTRKGSPTGLHFASIEKVPVADGDVIIQSPQMMRLHQMVRKVADSLLTVLIVGETGAGKEIIAEALHKASPRHDRPFLRVNCACLAETLLESELFGYEKGAFSGADRRKIGYFEAADGGTIFLDEIGEISPTLQSKLLRVIENRKIIRVGGTQEIVVDVRLVCATNRDLERECEKGTFRQDLLFRIGSFTLPVPPLRDRREEILPLADFFLRRAAHEQKIAVPELSPEVASKLTQYPWPGNVRELRGTIERGLILHVNLKISLDDLPDKIRFYHDESLPTQEKIHSTAQPEASDVRNQLVEFERAALALALKNCDGNQTQAAKKLGISRRALIYRMEKVGLKSPPGK